MKTTRIIIALLAVCIEFIHADPVARPKMAIPLKGEILSGPGDITPYTLTVEREIYFAGLDGETYRFKFPPEHPLPNDAGNKTAIANLIVRYYTGALVHADAKFEASFKDWKLATKFQKNGHYIQCITYPQQRIWIDLRYSVDGKSILEAIVSQGIAQ